MWVVKLGGSLNADPLLPTWLEVLARHGGGRAVLVGGGGRFADAVREAQARWGFDDLAAHNMALLAMVQTAYQWRALSPALHLLHDEAAIGPALGAGHCVLWTPLALLTDQADIDTSWEVTSDSLALALAQRHAAQGLVVVKSCAVEPGDSLASLVQSGVVDRRFADQAAAAPLPIVFMHRNEPQRLGSLLAAGGGGAPTARRR